MHTIIRAIKRNKMLDVVYILMLLLSLHSYLPMYINSSFLNTFTNEQNVSLLYTVASIISIFFYIYFPKIINWLGNYRATVLAVLIDIAAVLALILGKSTLTLAISFMVQQAILSLLFLNLDQFLENYSSLGKSHKNTGRIHAIYFSIANLALIVSPSISGLLIRNDSDYWKIYSLSALILLPILLLLRMEFSTFKDLKYREPRLIQTIRASWKNKNIRNITIANFFLQLFYSWMVIFTPIYLHENIGMTWSAIGIVFSIMLVPFLLFEFPVAWLSDNVMGEKEMLVIGFFIMAVATMCMAFPTSTSIVVWASILFMTRVGASMVEICTESYFFKKITAEESNKISLFRMMRPVSYIITPALIFSSNYLITQAQGFIIIGALLVGAIYFALHIRDTL